LGGPSTASLQSHGAKLVSTYAENPAADESKS
jgi:hypothetical protein